MDVIFQEHPTVTIGGNHFICPTILQWEDIPLMQVGKFESAGFTTQFSVYYSDGTKVAVVKGSQIYLTDEGKKAALNMRHEPNLTACELEGRTIFELRRQGAAALKGAAELYAPDGAFITCNDSKTASLLGTGGSLTVASKGTIHLADCTIQAPIGILFTKDGGIRMGSMSFANR